MAVSESISGSKSVSGGRSGSRKEPASPGVQRRSLLYPALIVVVLITQIPFLLTLYLSLQSWNIIRPDLGREFVGLSNYAREIFIA